MPSSSYQGRPSAGPAPLSRCGPAAPLGVVYPRASHELPCHRWRRIHRIELVDALVRRGDRVTVVDNLSTGRRENLAGVLERGAALHVADVRDAGSLAEIFAADGPNWCSTSPRRWTCAIPWSNP